MCTDNSVSKTDAKALVNNKLVCLTWNIEGYFRNKFELRQIIDSSNPDLLFLSEPMLFQPDAQIATSLISSTYRFHLNSDDLYDHDLPLLKNKANGGTLTAWKNELDPFVTLLRTDTSRILPILLDIPGYQPTAHINIYLPTSGQDNQYIEELANLQATIDHIYDICPSAIIHIRGDANASFVERLKHKRDKIFKHFCSNNFLEPLSLDHHTYHHFMGSGSSDSNIDVILSSAFACDGTPAPPNESLLEILCGKVDTRVSNSHHDVVLTVLTLNIFDAPPAEETQEVPTIENVRHRIIWNDDSLQAYSDLVSPVLAELRENWLDSSSPSSISILLQQTNTILSAAAKATQKVVQLGKVSKPSKPKIPPDIIAAANNLKKRKAELTKIDNDPSCSPSTSNAAKDSFSAAKAQLQRAKRGANLADHLKRDTDLAEILTSNPKSLFSSIRNKKRQSVKIHKLNVGSETFTGDDVGKGFFQSISKLKTKNSSELSSSKSFQQILTDHQHILAICQSGSKIPPISLNSATKLLKSIKSQVADYYSISALHYLNGGQEAMAHFQLLINAVLEEVHNYSLSEMNKCYAIILHKGHGKDKHSDRSYRTISSCPFIAKCADKYIGWLAEDDWSSAQAETQFQGKGLSHEHAALLLTESINFSVNSNKLPTFCLLLDAKSAFDRALREILIRRTYLEGTTGHALLYLDKRLENRSTIIEWDKCHMGPIHDQQGVEQGGPNSSDQYKLYNNEQFTVAQKSNFGVSIGPITVSSVGQADDAALVSSDFNNLGHLLHLTMKYCEDYHVEMTPEKTKLLVFSPKSSPDSKYTDYFKSCNFLHINDVPLSFVDSAEHVGVLRSVAGNLPHILQRITNHKKALGAVLSTGMARHHRGNPAASQKVEKLYGMPVLLSGVAPLTLLQSEIQTLGHHYKETLQGLLKLHFATPEPVVLFLAGSLPLEAILHMRQLTLFIMIAQLPDNILNRIARYILTIASDSSSSWFVKIKTLCHKYFLPHPLLLLQNPPKRDVFKKTAKLKILDFWKQKLSEDAAPLPSLCYFKPQFMSLDKPHIIWRSCGSNPYEIQKAVIQTRMLSGRYRDDSLSRHFTNNASGECLLCKEHNPASLSPSPIGDLPHLLLHCPLLTDRRTILMDYWLTLTSDSPACRTFVMNFPQKPEPYQMQFLLDCSALPDVIHAVQVHDETILTMLLKITRTYCYSIHRDRLKKLDRWC